MSFLKRILLGYKRQTVHSRALFWFIIGVVLILLVPSIIRHRSLEDLSQARIYFLEPQQHIIPGQIFPVEVRLQTTGTAINAVSTYVRYNPLFLEVVNMTTEKSFCTFYLDNSFDNIKGEVNISCGVPNPGFTGDSIVVRMNMRAKAAGSTRLTLDPEQSRVLANDGKGTNITQELPDLPLTVQALF